MYFDDDEQSRLRTVFAAVVSDAPMAPELEQLGDRLPQQLIPPLRQSTRMRGVGVMAGAAAAVLLVVGVVGLLVLREPDGAAQGTMQSGSGPSPAVEALLLEHSSGDLLNEFIPGTGSHVATYAGLGGPVEFYSYEATTVTPELTDGDIVVPSMTFHSYCLLGFGPSPISRVMDCGADEPLFPIQDPQLMRFDIADIDGSGIGLVSVPPDVREVIFVFNDETEISVRPASGVAYAVWQSGEFPQVDIIQADGTRKRVRPPS